MLRERISRLFENQSKKIKLLGMYTIVVLAIFAVMVPLIGQELKRKETGLPRTSQSADAENMPNDNSAPGLDTGLTNPAQDAIDQPVKSESGTVSGKGPQPAEENTAKTAPASADIKSMTWPLKGELLQGVGIVYSKTFSDYRYHNGIDIQAARGAEIAAVLPGKVLSRETSGNEAKRVVIDHGSGWRSVYAHLEEVYVKPGNTVRAGQVIGHIGQPGLNEILEGPHLHFTLLQEGKVVNPLDYLPQ